MLVTISLVTYHNTFKDLRKVIDSTKLIKVKYVFYIVDNSKDREIEVLCNDDNIIYIKNDKNVGFGTAHNVAINKAIELNSDYHLIINPDIYFEDDVIEKMVSVFELDETIGLSMPKILYPNGETQYLCKLIPTPYNLIFRRFLPSKSLQDRINIKYELRFSNYNRRMNVPCLSGCFMFCRTSVLESIGGFDERFFMYLEDIDLTRRIHENYKTLFLSEIEVYHQYAKGSYKNLKLLKYHIFSAIKYFNKWGWIYDPKRKKTNKITIKNILSNNEG
jgi:GT2 family glycosyltransferase